MQDAGFLPAGWEPLPEDEWDGMPVLPEKEIGMNMQKGEETDNAGME